MSQGSFDPSKRRLCPDGACIGVIGDDGRCRVCGRAGDGSAAASASPPTTTDDDFDTSDDPYGFGDDLADQAQSGEGGGEAPAQVAAAGGGGFRPDRPLCDDGSCIGVIGPDGRCGVCGRAQGG